jgi:hypothetical protein
MYSGKRIASVSRAGRMVSINGADKDAMAPPNPDLAIAINNTASAHIDQYVMAEPSRNGGAVQLKANM